MPPLSLEARKDLQAVGRINSAGYRSLTGCTGTLIAPDLVVTAAHCVKGSRINGPHLHFVAGWDRGSFAAHRVSTEITTYPSYEMSSGEARFAADIAVMRLNEPIESANVRPLDLAPPRQPAGDTARLLGYHNVRSNVLNGHESCTALTYSNPRLRLYDCEVISGNSGGPVIERAGENGWRVTGVIVGRGGDKGRALVVPVNDWLFRQWRAALARSVDSG